MCVQSELLGDCCLAGVDRPDNFICAEEPRHGIRHCSGIESMPRRIFRMIDGQQWGPGRIRVGVWVTVCVGTGYRRPRPPGPIHVLGFEPDDY